MTLYKARDPLRAGRVEGPSYNVSYTPENTSSSWFRDLS